MQKQKKTVQIKDFEGSSSYIIHLSLSLYIYKNQFFQIPGSLPLIRSVCMCKILPRIKWGQSLFSVSGLRRGWIMDSLAVFIYYYFVKWKDFGVDTLSLAEEFNQYSPLSMKPGGVITLFRWKGRSWESCPRLCRQLGLILNLELSVFWLMASNLRDWAVPMAGLGIAADLIALVQWMMCFLFLLL